MDKFGTTNRNYTMHIMQCTERDTVTQVPGRRGKLQQMRKERPLRKSM